MHHTSQSVKVTWENHIDQQCLFIGMLNELPVRLHQCSIDSNPTTTKGLNLTLFFRSSNSATLLDVWVFADVVERRDSLGRDAQLPIWILKPLGGTKLDIQVLAMGIVSFSTLRRSSQRGPQALADIIWTVHDLATQMSWNKQ